MLYPVGIITDAESQRFCHRSAPETGFELTFVPAVPYRLIGGGGRRWGDAAATPGESGRATEDVALQLTVAVAVTRRLADPAGHVAKMMQVVPASH